MIVTAIVPPSTAATSVSSGFRRARPYLRCRVTRRVQAQGEAQGWAQGEAQGEVQGEALSLPGCPTQPASLPAQIPFRPQRWQAHCCCLRGERNSSSQPSPAAHAR